MKRDLLIVRNCRFDNRFFILIPAFGDQSFVSFSVAPAVLIFHPLFVKRVYEYEKERKSAFSDNHSIDFEICWISVECMHESNSADTVEFWQSIDDLLVG
jgi:hypothetical protein